MEGGEDAVELLPLFSANATLCEVLWKNIIFFNHSIAESIKALFNNIRTKSNFKINTVE